MKLVVGLGNPGREYEQTRHNIGWEIVTEVARRHVTGRAKIQFEGETAEMMIDDHRGLLLFPHTFMNASGRSVRKACDYYDIAPAEILVVCDDFQLPLTQLRMRAGGSSGGQKGLKDIILRIGTEDFSRLRFGIGSPPPRWDTANYVLGRFSKDERAEVEQALVVAADAVSDWVRYDIDYCMNRYNASTSG
ncbi:MAG: aminoacyl-tRNA hydrolase [Pirellulaceae bacterium]|nr:aminoacyl-tRNA hydrolase [Pirellulaceae bacterium]